MFIAGLTPVACSLSVKGRHLHPVAVYCSHKELSDGKCACARACVRACVCMCMCMCMRVYKSMCVHYVP